MEDMKKEKDIEKARELWETLQNVPVRDSQIREDWHIFKKGASVNEIWHWFEKEFNVSLLEDIVIPEDPDLQELIDMFERHNKNKPIF